MGQVFATFFNTASNRFFGSAQIPNLAMDDAIMLSHLETDVDVIDVGNNHHCMTIDDLPPIGQYGVVYSLSDTRDMYVWTGDHYVTYNPYDTQGSGRPLLTDHTSFMPSGGSLSMSIVYAIWALREDLRLMKQYGWKMQDLIKKPWQVNSMPVETQWFRSNHTNLVDNLRKAVNSGGTVEQSVQDALNNMGAHLWFNRETRQCGFKDSSFTVMF